MSFSSRWLQLREPFDHAARSEAVAARFADALQGTGPPLRLLALGAGLGSGLRWLAPRLGGPQEWILVDHDPRLLSEAGAVLERWAEQTGRAIRRDGPVRWLGPLSVRTLQADLRSLEALPDAIDAVVCQALLDLASHDWLAALAEWLAARRLPFLAALTVDGRVRWSPPHPLDEPIQAAFRLHQLGDRGFGPSPGWGAAQQMADHLKMHGYSTYLERADWQIGPRAPEMLAHMVQGTAEAARELHPHPAHVDRWEQHRLQAVRSGELSLKVGHVDLVATPGPPDAPPGPPAPR